MDKIRILNLKIPGRHGVYNFENIRDQLFELDVEMHKQLSYPCETDDLKDTVDYAAAVNLITNVFSSRNYNLLEAVGESICKSLIKEFSIEKVIIKIRKPHAPISANIDTVEIELTRSI